MPSSSIDKTLTIKDGGHVHDSDEELSQLLSVATNVLRQGIDLVENVLASDQQLTVHSKYLPGSTIGKHLRHVREHFMLLVASVSTSSPSMLSYDTRPRNTAMESSLCDARSSLVDTVKCLAETVPRISANQPLILKAATPFPQSFQTSFGRELWFATLHAIHHWSMIRLIAGELNIELQQDFGIAPSTLLHQGREVARAKF